MKGILVQALLSAPLPYLFCWFGGYRLPTTFWDALVDLGVSYLTLIVMMPALIPVVLCLKLFFYGSQSGGKLRVSEKTKLRVSIGTILVAFPVSLMIGSEGFLWFTERTYLSNVQTVLRNGFITLVIGAPGTALSIYKAKKHIAKVVKQRQLENSL